VIALDTPTEPQDATDALFATDNFKAGVLIGEYAKAAMAGKPAKIATLDLAPGITVGQLRHDGFLKGYGIQEGDAQIVCSQDTRGDQAKGQTAMENCLQKAPDINVVYTINEPAAAGAYQALKSAGKAKGVLIVSVDGGCVGVKNVKSGHLAATSQQYPLKMAVMGVDAGVEYAKSGKKASGYTDTGVTLITDKPMSGVDSKDTKFGTANCWASDRNVIPDVATAPPARGRLLERLPPVATLGPLVALFLACAFFAWQSDRFLSGSNFSLILQQVMVVGVVAIGQTLVILTAGIDLSCGMLMALGSIVMTKLAVDYEMSPLLAILCGLMASTAFGFLNGALITRVKLPAFIVTLGTLNIAFAITQIYSKSQTVSGLPEALEFFGRTFSIGETAVTYGTVLMLVMYLITWFILRDTAPGRHIYALGNNAEATRLMGIDTLRMLLCIYTIAGLLYGVAGLLLVARTGVGDPQAGQTDNLDSITAVVLGGTSLFGGRGSILGTLLGALIVGVFRNGLTLMGVASVYQILITGILVILAVTTDQLSRRKG